MHVRLKILQGSNTGKELKIPTPKCNIGRGEDCHLRPNSDAISRHHCVIESSENEVIVRDLKSRNGTFVNEEKVTDVAVLLNGDILRVMTAGTNTPNGPGVRFSATMTFVGGTGRFANATGQAQVEGAASFITNTASFTVDGWIAYDGQTASGR